MIYIIRFLFGTAKIKIECEFPEKVLNYMAKNNINFWNIYKNNQNLYFSLFKKDLEKIKKVQEIKYSVIEKGGFLNKITKYKMRFGFLVGFIVFMVLTVNFSNRIWNIEINGNKEIETSEIAEALKSLNIDVGMSKNFGDPNILRQKLILKVDRIAWASINTEGTTVFVNISESTEFNKNSPSNLIAKYDGIIKKIDVSNGNVLVNVGDTVYKNQILVSGEMYDDGIRRKSIGTITADITEKYKYKIPLLNEKRYYIKDRTEYLITFLGIRIPLYLEKNTNDREDMISVSEISLAGQKLPVTLYKKAIKEYSNEFFAIDEDTALKFAELKLKNELNSNGIEYFNIFEKAIEKHGNYYEIGFSVNFKSNIAKEDFLEKNNEK